MLACIGSVVFADNGKNNPHGSIHPFQDGNGRVGRLAMLKECLTSGIVPFVITDDMKGFYYRGLSEWDRENGFLRDTCLAAQDSFKTWLDYFRIPYDVL